MGDEISIMSVRTLKRETGRLYPRICPTIEPFSLRSDLLGTQPHLPVHNEEGVIRWVSDGTVVGGIVHYARHKYY